jgi:hypothetical protein
MMVPRLDEATWRASNRASASTREQGEALGAQAAAGVRASADAPSSPSHRSLTRGRGAVPVRTGKKKGKQGKKNDMRARFGGERKEERAWWPAGLR